MRDSIAVKRNSDIIGDNITTADIGQLPDVTIAEELNRLPGVNTTRDRGNASQASIRGLGPRLILGLVNGREVASSEPSQDLRWEIYPSEVLSAAIVNKTQDATLISGGLAATVDIRTLSPLDYKGPEFSFRAGPTYNSEGKDLPCYNPLGYRASGGMIKHINDDFAVSLAASAQREKNGFPDFRTWGWNTPSTQGKNTGDLNGDGVPDNTTWGLNTEIKEVTQDRYALAGAAGWRASDSLTIKADALWSQYEIKENQFQAWYGNNITGTGRDDGPEHTRDRISAIAVSFARTFENPTFTGVKFGARASDREKTHHNNRWGLCAGTGSASFTTLGGLNSEACPAGTAGQGGVPPISLANAGLSSFTAPGFVAPPLVYGNFDRLFPLVYPNSGAPAGSDMPLERTKVTEKSYEGFVRLDFASSIGNLPLTGGVGVRVAHVKTESSGYQALNGTFSPVVVDNDYTNVLPRLNATLHLTDTQLLRFGASIAVARPPLDTLTTGYTLNSTGSPKTGGGGNPKLDPFKADQLDFSYEWYFHEESLLAIAPFYKYVKTYIGAGQSTKTIGGTQYFFTSENNTKGGEIGGVELTLQSRFFFLPGFLQDFGVYANHAQTESNIHEAAPTGHPYPMVGLARGTTEFDVFYNNLGFESRVAVKHHTAFTVAPTWVGTTLKMPAPETTLDATVSSTFPNLC